MMSKLYKLAALLGDADVNWDDNHLRVVAHLDDSDIEILQLPSAVYPPHGTNKHHQLKSRSSHQLGNIGVCAMENKVLSKSNQAIFHHLKANNNIEIILFGDNVLSNQPIEAGLPVTFSLPSIPMDFHLIRQYPYTQLRSPIFCNDLLMQSYSSIAASVSKSWICSESELPRGSKLTVTMALRSN